MLRLPWPILVGVLFAALIAPQAPAETVVDDDSDTLRIRAGSVLSKDDVRIEVHTGRDGRRSGITIRGNASRASGPSMGAHSSDVVRIGESVVIRDEQTVDGDVVAVLGNIKVFGRVNGDVVSVMGTVIVEENGVVHGDAVSVMGTVFIRDNGAVSGDAVGIGGGVRKDPGARLGGENVAISFVPGVFLGAGDPRMIGPFFGASAILFSMLLLFLIGWLVLALGEPHVRRIGAQVQEHLWRSLLTGVAAMILFPFAIILLFATIVGIPLALLLPVVFPLAHLVGFVIVAGVVGLRLAGRNGTTRSEQTYGLVIGLLFFLGIMLVGQLVQIAPGPLRFFGIILTVFGLASTFVAAMIGFGALILSRFGMEPRQAKPQEPSMMPPGPPAGTHPLATT